MSDRDRAAEAVARSRAAQGLPRHVEDPAALARVAALLVGDPDTGRQPTVGQHEHERTN